MSRTAVRKSRLGVAAAATLVAVAAPSAAQAASASTKPPVPQTFYGYASTGKGEPLGPAYTQAMTSARNQLWAYQLRNRSTCTETAINLYQSEGTFTWQVAAVISASCTVA